MVIERCEITGEGSLRIDEVGPLPLIAANEFNRVFDQPGRHDAAASGQGADPTVNDAFARIGEGCHSGEPVIPVEDAQAQGVALQDDGRGECTCFFDVSPSGEKFYARVSNVCGECIDAVNVPLDKGGDNVLRTRMEGGELEPGEMLSPNELADGLEALTVEHIKPSQNLG